MPPDEVEDRLGQLGTAHDQVGQGHVVLVVLQLRAVDPGAEQAGGPGETGEVWVRPTPAGRRADWDGGGWGVDAGIDRGVTRR